MNWKKLLLIAIVVAGFGFAAVTTALSFGKREKIRGLLIAREIGEVASGVEVELFTTRPITLGDDARIFEDVGPSPAANVEVE